MPRAETMRTAEALVNAAEFMAAQFHRTSFAGQIN
jgi:hypothetical protein